MLLANYLPLELHADDDEITQALAAVHMGPWLAQLPRGLDTVLAECGGDLSIGQKQLISLSRAVLAKNKLLVLLCLSYLCISLMVMRCVCLHA